MSTLRITNIEAKADPSSPTVDEKIKLTNSNGDILVHIDGKTSGITTIGINTTAGNIKFDQNSNVVVTGIITATKFVGTIEPTSLEIGSNIKLGNAGVITATSYVGDGSALTGIDATQIQTGNTSVQTVDTGSDGHVKITTEGTERLRITSAGNIGINKTPTTYKFEVNGGTANTVASFESTDATSRILFKDNSGEAMVGAVGDALTFYTSTNATERLRIDSSGRLGIGNDSPSEILDIIQSAQGDAATLRIRNSADSNASTNVEIVARQASRTGGRIVFGRENANSWSSAAGYADGFISFNPTDAGSDVERMRITSSGNVGINQVPTRELSLHSPNNNNALIHFTNDDTGETASDGSLVGIDGNEDFLVSNQEANKNIRIFNNGAERMRLDSSGNVGINNTAPADKLHVGGNIRFGTNTTYYGVIEHEAGVTGSNIYTSKDTGGHIFKTGTSPAEKVRIDNSGRLLVGTTTEGYNSADNFTIADTGNCGLTIRSATNGLGTIAFSDATSGTGEYSGFIQYNQSNRHLTFGTESDEHVRIDNNGHLEVDYDGSNNARVQFGFASGVWITGNSSDGHQRFYTNSNVRILSGYNGQGTEFHNQNSVRPGADNSIDLGSGSYRYDDVYATNGTIQTSDSRLKQEVETSVLGIDFVKALRPVSYKWIEGKKVPIVDSVDENGDNVYRSDDNGNWAYESRAGARRHWGFIAQEVKQAVDDAGVDFAGWSLTDKDDPDSTQSLRYEEFISPLTKALQEAIAKIETLESQVAALQGS